MSLSISALAKNVLQQYSHHKSSDAFTVAISGIDASGKGYIAAQLKKILEEKGLRVALLGMDDWQQPKSIALHTVKPAENFYYNVFRWTAFFDSLFFPLKQQKSIALSVKQFANPHDEVVIKDYQYEKIDLIITEGVFLLKRDLYMLFDYTIWIECSFNTSISRALLRKQEGVSNEQIVHDYNTIYHPAQCFHFEKDHPKSIAHCIFNNDE